MRFTRVWLVRTLSRFAQLMSIGPPPHVQPFLRAACVRQNDIRVAPGAGSIRRLPDTARLATTDVDFRPARQSGRRAGVTPAKRLIALSLQRAMVNPGRVARPRERLVLPSRPQSPPMRDELLAVPLARLDPPQACGSRLPQCQ